MKIIWLTDTIFKLFCQAFYKVEVCTDKKVWSRHFKNTTKLLTKKKLALLWDHADFNVSQSKKSLKKKSMSRRHEFNLKYDKTVLLAWT